MLDDERIPLNVTRVVKYIDKELPEIYNKCEECKTILFISIDTQYVTPHKMFCLDCFRNLGDKYDL